MLIPIIVAIVGLVAWWPPLNSKVNEAGKILFIAGVFFTLYSLTGKFN